MAADLSSKKAAYVGRLLSRIGLLLDAMDDLKPERAEWDEMGWSSLITDEDLEGIAKHLVASNLGDAMNSIDALFLLRSQGHGTNLQKMRL